MDAADPSALLGLAGGTAAALPSLENTLEAHRRASFLVQAATRLLATSLDPDQTLQQLTALAVPSVADSCVVRVLDEATGELRVAACASHDATPLTDDDDDTLSRVIRTGRAELGKPAVGTRRWATMIAPLNARQRIIGVVTLAMTDTSRYYEEADLEMLEQLALNAGLAVENARLYRYEQKARNSIERAANRMRRLQTITTDLAAALTNDDVAKAVTEHCVAAAGAMLGGIWLFDQGSGTIELARWQGNVEPPPDYRRLPVDCEAPVCVAFRTGSPVFVEVHEDFERDFPEYARRHTEVSSFVCVPLGQRKVLGVLMFAFGGPRVFDADERAFLVLVGDHCALGFYRAAMYEAEQRARSEMALLYGFVDAVNRATTLAEVFDASHEVVHRALDVTRSSILLFDDDDVVRFKSWRGLSDGYRATVEGHSPWSHDAKDPPPVFVPDTETDESSAPLREIFRKESIRGLAYFPLTYRGKLLGKFMVYSPTVRVFTSEEVRLAQTIAAQISLAVARKLAEVEVDVARAAAEHASRMKDEFLAIVSHELRTPLASITGWASILQTERGDDPATKAKGLEVIARNAKAQATLIEDLLDVSRIIRGKLRLDPHPIALIPLVMETVDALGTSATAKEIVVEVEAEEGLSIVGDPERLRQITWNLLSNAIKFTPPKGKVRIRVRREAGAVLLEVSDTGIGIASHLLPYIFDRFRQADGTTTRRHGGLGLGLSIVRHLVELHGGQMTVQSAGPGKGSTFVARLPVRNVTQAPQQARADGDAAPAEAPPSAATGPLPQLAGVRVLVVDDQADARDMFEEALASYGAVVEAASSADEAVEVLRTFEPEVLVTDIGMPDKDGYELLRAVRALPGPLGQVPAVAVTAYARPEDARRARAAGFREHVAKPTPPKDLARAVMRALGLAKSA
jgi:signal transduction histidine kinase/ActR/RegA family two-component response regulator/uncharacterized protein YigA (DUF484 family)